MRARLVGGVRVTIEDEVRCQSLSPASSLEQSGKNVSRKSLSGQEETNYRAIAQKFRLTFFFRMEVNLVLLGFSVMYLAERCFLFLFFQLI